MEKIYRDADVDMTILEGRTIAVIGYGIQGKSFPREPTSFSSTYGRHL
jgi:ketol-acid reductoisomerase